MLYILVAKAANEAPLRYKGLRITTANDLLITFS